ncbi:acyl carrier protein [Limibacterium fermenti]|uniref:acyl carrier protein n=1 Tax=Limibacterium fermenti TaxID=3229863 RepID=UPI003A5DE30B
MEVKDFIENFALIFDETDPAELTTDTVFRDLDEWSSLTALGLIAVIEEEYEVELNSKDLENSITVGDIYDIVKTKK